MTLFLTVGFLAREVFPPLDRHIDVGWVDLDGVDAAPLLLTGNECGARPELFLRVRHCGFLVLVPHGGFGFMERFVGELTGEFCTGLNRFRERHRDIAARFNTRIDSVLLAGLKHD